MMDMIDDYRYLLALHLQDISKRYGVLYYDVLRGKLPAEAQEVYSEGLAQVFEYMNLRHGLEMEDIMAVHETVMETVLAGFVGEALHITADQSQLLH
ncbi:hypothetical protein [Sporomusa acidovorans]|uniref:Uncharacterized protein n=1 Tax=Sporomusa acidovorans (strain ATCC 49682 / DSM 3132 / Mol) TaxID=1123286 RepID=A0ABZ3J9K6_SPOA4|nr:hypothetical protein [Sporomusa acidovorans]OZC21813.1 hypothetical protein SPACI_18880 [Sporomusa acidovorans DSM 3132]SDD56100.1 hypothetical protein SAMN04488499_100245 [Sporomusa acidovorans]